MCVVGLCMYIVQSTHNVFYVTLVLTFIMLHNFNEVTNLAREHV